MSLQEMVVFKRRQLTYYTGNYEEYVTQVEERQLHQARQADAVERKREHTEKRWAGGVSWGPSCWPSAGC
jgi:ATPase subunit of ABC transporter with duplicated ATPase domains